MSDKESDNPPSKGEDLELESWDDLRYGNRVWWDPSAEIRDAKLEQKQGRAKEMTPDEDPGGRIPQRRRNAPIQPVLESFTELNPSAPSDEEEHQSEAEQEAAPPPQPPPRAPDPPKSREVEPAVSQAVPQNPKGRPAPLDPPETEVSKEFVPAPDPMDLEHDSRLKIGNIAPQPRPVQPQSPVEPRTPVRKSGRHDETPAQTTQPVSDVTNAKRPLSDPFQDLSQELPAKVEGSQGAEPMVFPQRGPIPGRPSEPLEGAVTPSLPPDYSIRPAPNKESNSSRAPDRLGRPDPPARNLTDILPESLSLDLDGDEAAVTGNRDVSDPGVGEGTPTSWGGFSSKHEPEEFDKGTRDDPVAAANRLGAWLAGVFIVLAAIAVTAWVLWKFV